MVSSSLPTVGIRTCMLQESGPFSVLICARDFQRLGSGQNARLLEMGTMGATNPHPHFRGRIPAQYWTIMNQHGLDPRPSRGNRRADPRHASSNYANLVRHLLPLESVGFPAVKKWSVASPHRMKNFVSVIFDRLIDWMCFMKK